ncbi:MAG: tartrate-resistant acid phosphatase type 5 [Verrucomicrobiales bacterium]|jgi:tartrate-resistant acid phosphatase type 5
MMPIEYAEQDDPIDVGDVRVGYRKHSTRVWTWWIALASLSLLGWILLRIFWPTVQFGLATEVPGVVVSRGGGFELSPPDGVTTIEPLGLNFMVVGDTGTGASLQRDVADAMAIVAKERRSDFVLMLGDNFYNSGVKSVSDPQWQSKFEQIYRSRLRKIPFYACLGNHDHRGNVEAQIDYSKQSERWRMPARYYTFTQPITGGDDMLIEFFVIDSDPITRELPESQAQLVWLENALESSTARWKVVAGHHPLRSGGRPSTATKPVREALLPIFQRAPVDLYLSGHDHYLEFGTADHGINYGLSGAGSKLQRRVVRHSYAEAATKQLGFLLVEVGVDELRLRMIGLGGELPDQKVIKKPGNVMVAD